MMRHSIFLTVFTHAHGIPEVLIVSPMVSGRAVATVPSNQGYLTTGFGIQYEDAALSAGSGSGSVGGQLQRQLAVERADAWLLGVENSGLREENSGLQEENAGLWEENRGLQAKNIQVEDENGVFKAKIDQLEEENAQLRAAA